MAHELHIDLLRCEHCGQHSKHLNFCAPCGRPRNKIIIAAPHDYKKDYQLDFRCRTCHAQASVSPWCHYCDRSMKMQRSTRHVKDAYVSVRTQEDEDREWVRIRRARAKKHGKKRYTYGKGLATNFAAPFIARLRKEANRDPAYLSGHNAAP